MNKPCFSGFLSNPVLINSSYTTLTFNKLTNCYNDPIGTNNGILSNNDLIIPEAGVYQSNVTINFEWNHNRERREIGINILRNGSRIAERYFEYNGNDVLSFNFSEVFELNQGDDIQVEVGVPTVMYGRQYVSYAPSTSFSIYKL